MLQKTFSEMKFYTAAEVAEILRVNHQVLARKLQAGEIPAYKVGKDWRIEEGELQAWLRNTSNQRLGKSQSEEETVYRNFFVGGRLKQIPARRSKREVVLRILVQSFHFGQTYTEPEVNEILSSFHEDFCTLRRELIMARLLAREAGRYWRPGDAAKGEAAKVAQGSDSAETSRGEASAPPSHT